MKNIIDKLKNGIFPDKEEFVYFLSCEDEDTISYLHDAARQKSLEVFGSKVYIRGLIEFTNYCKNDCFYCGIRNSNKNVRRYRLTNDDILECASSGYSLGFRTFVLQGGDCLLYTSPSICFWVLLRQKTQ